MCKACYKKYGKEMKAYLCEHTDRPHMARGYCKDCYVKEVKALKFANKCPHTD